MKNAAYWSGLVWIMIGALALARPALGQNLDAATILYSHGVHAYFAGHVGEAADYLAQAIRSNPNDPRAYYFRGLCLLRLGEPTRARADFDVGAAVEARQPNRYAVGSALVRVQGGNRLLLEKCRRQAREQYALEREMISQARYEQMVNREADVLRQRVAVPVDQLVPPGEAPQPVDSPIVAAPPTASPAPTATGAADDPFADDPIVPGPAEPAQPAATDSASPAPVSDEPLDLDPFVAPAETDDATTPAEPPTDAPAAPDQDAAEPPADSLFGSPAAAPDDDPFSFDDGDPFAQ